MATRPPLALTLKWEIGWNGPDSQKATNIMYLLCSADPTSGTTMAVLAQDLFNGLKTANGTTEPLLNFTAAEWSVYSSTVIDNSGETEEAVAYLPGVAGQGQVSANCMPASVAYCWSWQVTGRWRGGHPRSYMPGLPEGSLTIIGGKTIATATQSNLAGAGVNLLNAVAAITINSITFQLGTIRYSSGHAPIVPPKFLQYLGCAVHPRLDSQRRRLGKETTVA